jgi:predicted porin
MRLLKSLLLASAAGLLAVSAAAAADLPTKKTPPAAAKPNCYASFMTWLDSTAADCPLSAYGVTLYGTIDMGGGYETHASKFNRDYSNGVSELVAKTSGNSRWQAVPNGLSQSNVGVKIKEQVVPNWFIVGDVNFGFDPYSFQFANGPASLEDNNFLGSNPSQSANGDSSRAGGIDNTRAYLGVSNPTFGTLTFGRQYALTNDLSGAYDPFGGAYAFSLIGTSGSVEQGTGMTETARENTAFKYLLSYNGLRASAIAQVGGWSDGNGAQAAYQLGLGGDWNGFSVDAIYAYAKDAVKLGTYGKDPTLDGYAPDTLKATLADVNAGVVGAKYKWQALTLYSGYEYARLSTASDFDKYYGSGKNVYDLNNSWTDYPGLIGKDPFGHKNGRPEDLQVLWVGAKYGILSNLDAAIGYYYEWQNNYDYSPNAAVAKGSNLFATTNCGANNTRPIAGAAPQGTYKSDCAGHTSAISGMLDWRPVKRVDIYGGVMYSEVAGGMATGFTHTNNTAYTGGVRINF